MVARIFIVLLLLILLPDLYVDRMILRRKASNRNLVRGLWWFQSVVFCIYTLMLTFSRDFAPSSITVLNVYLFIIGAIVVPKFVFAMCHFLGWAHCRYHHTTTNYGNHVGGVLAAGLCGLVIYGSTLGFSKVTVRHETFYSKDLPKEFDGYRIAHLSDAHVGTFNGSLIKILEKEADMVNALKPDLIVFTGDIQNMQPGELAAATPALSSMKAKDGVYSILGNHDYADYIKADDSVKRANERELVERERAMGWKLLLNENSVIRRGQDSIVIAGMENDGRPPFPQKGDLHKTMAGVDNNSFVLMLEHDPTAWRRKILPGSHAQLTLSGHTHAMQFEVMGWSPASFIYNEWGGMYNEGNRALNVSVGMGGFIPFRIGASNEIVLITLKCG